MKKKVFSFKLFFAYFYKCNETRTKGKPFDLNKKNSCFLALEGGYRLGGMVTSTFHLPLLANEPD